MAAWAGPDPGKWLGRQPTRLTLVYEHDGILRGFAELLPEGHLDGFYVSADRQRQGVGAALLYHIEAEALARGARRLTTEASITAVPFFTARGWHVEGEQEVRYQGETFQIFHLSKSPGAAVIARGAKRAVAIQLDCFVAPQAELLAMTVYFHRAIGIRHRLGDG